MVLVHREVSAIRLNLAQEVLHHPDAVRVHSRCGQAHDLVENMMSLDARAFERQQAQVHVNGDAKDARHAIHRVAHAPGARSAREHEHASAANDRGLVSKWGGDGGRVSLSHDIAPDGLHVQRVCSHAMMVKQRVTQGVGSQSGLRPRCAKTAVLVFALVFVLVFVLDKIEVLDGLDHSMAWLVIDVILILLVKEVEALQDLLALAVIIGNMLTESLHPCLPSGVARLPPAPVTFRGHIKATLCKVAYLDIESPPRPNPGFGGRGVPICKAGMPDPSTAWHQPGWSHRAAGGSGAPRRPRCGWPRGACHRSRCPSWRAAAGS